MPADTAPAWTPGEWFVSRQGLAGSIVIRGAGDPKTGPILASVSKFYGSAHVHGDHEANARLIAAAPTLYEALAAMCREFTHGNPDQREAISAARAALALARRESQP